MSKFSTPEAKALMNLMGKKEAIVVNDDLTIYVKGSTMEDVIKITAELPDDASDELLGDMIACSCLITEKGEQIFTFDEYKEFMKVVSPTVGMKILGLARDLNSFSSLSEGAKKK